VRVNLQELPDGLAGPDDGISVEELQLAARHHGMPLEALAYVITPIGMHYLLIHWDVPETDPDTWTVDVGGLVDRSLSLSMDDLRARPAVTMAVTMECAGNGRARLSPRPISQPWIQEAVGTAEWTGTPLAPILTEAGLRPDAVEILFTGADHGIQGDVEQDYQRSLSIEEAMREEVLLAYAINGQPLPPQHGSPVRLLVPGWYGMTSVKWLRTIEAIPEPFEGFQMDAYRIRDQADDAGVPVTYLRPRALMIPPGFPEFLARRRHLDAGPTEVRGRAWSGAGPVAGVEVSTDGGASWSDADLGPQPSRWAWAPWSFSWRATAGEHELLCRATDRAGNVQPVDQDWNFHGLQNNMTQRVPVVVR
jgi:DMSO/TMAO reductase YedYZ molybdopterin-dependent catalytic subunit